MSHLINSAKHAAYVFAISFLGTLGVQDQFLNSFSSAHAAEVALGPAALAALYKAAQSTGLLAYFNTAPTAPVVEPVSGLAPEAE